MNASAPNSTNVSKRRIWPFVVVPLLLFLAAFPWILAKSTLRDRLLNAIVSSDDITIQSTNASFGYMTPLSLSGLQIKSADDATRIQVADIQADRSWLGLIISRPDLGMFRFESPRLDVLVDPQKLKADPQQPEPVKSDKPAKLVDLPNLSAEINDASVIVRTPNAAEPPIDLQDIQLTLRLQKEANGSILTVEPTTVFDHQRITPQLCGQGLQLIAPLLADEVDAEGEFSLRLEQLQIPIGVQQADKNQAIQIKGELQLHRASVGLRNTIAKGIGDLVLKLLGSSAPEKMTVAKDLVVSFQVMDGRVHHEGLALLLPRGDRSIEILSSGSVGLDETLDLQVSIKLPDELLGGGALMQRLTKDPIIVLVTGNFEEPKVELASTGGMMDSIRGLIDGEGEPAATEESVDDVIGSAVDVVEGILGGLRERSEQRQESGEASPLLPGLLERLRDRPRLRDREKATREQAPADPESSTPAPPTPEPPAPEEPQPVDL